MLPLRADNQSVINWQLCFGSLLWTKQCRCLWCLILFSLESSLCEADCFLVICLLGSSCEIVPCSVGRGEWFCLADLCTCACAHTQNTLSARVAGALVLPLTLFSYSKPRLPNSRFMSAFSDLTVTTLNRNFSSPEVFCVPARSTLYHA